MEPRLKRNAIRCLSCNDIIESEFRHDFRTCSCGKVSVDGGLDYLKRSYPSGNDFDWFVELSEWQTQPDPSGLLVESSSGLTKEEHEVYKELRRKFKEEEH
jgi:hypothetical protein